MITKNQTKEQVINLHKTHLKDMCNETNTMKIRPVRIEDVPLIDEMHDRLSKDSIYFRYLGTSKPGINDLHKLCSTEAENGFVVVATVSEPQEKVIGIACYTVDPENPTAAEPAVLVEDSYQGCGIGKKIVTALGRFAVGKGVTIFVSYIHPVNSKVLRMIQGSGIPFESKYRDGLKEVRVQLV